MVRSWNTHDNGGRPFQVQKTGNVITVWKRSQTLESPHDSYPDQVAKYVVDKVFVGKSPLNKMTNFSGGHGRAFDGNSILIKLKNKNVYVFIGDRIFEFQAPEPIVSYSSPVGNSDVPYPFAESKSNVYLMLAPNGRAKQIDYFSKRLAGQDPYEPYYAWAQEIAARRKNPNLRPPQVRSLPIKIKHKRLLG